MAAISLHNDGQDSSTSVPNSFIDEYMSGANGEYVKIYLYLLRLLHAPDAAFSISSVADKLDHTEKDVRRALSYWERMKLLRLEYDDSKNLTGVCLLDTPPKENSQADIIHIRTASAETGSMSTGIPANGSPTDAAAGAQTYAAVTTIPPDVTYTSEPSLQSIPASVSALPRETATASMATLPRESLPPRRAYTPDDVREFSKDESVQEILFISERYLGRTLSATDVNTLLYLYDGLSFSAELIEYLVEYCVGRGHAGIRYIEKTALGWAADHISTVEEAKEAVDAHSGAYHAVVREFGITGRSLVPAEAAFLEKWKKTYGFTDELVSEACRRTMAAIHQPSFEYADSIMENWRKNRVKSMDDVAKLDAAYQSRKKAVSAAGDSSSTASATQTRNKFNNFKQRSYDYDQLEQLLLSSSAPRANTQ